MIYAYDEKKYKIEASPNSNGFCPGCGEALVARCGELKIWHWSHKGRRDCDDWYEPETEWHSGWKQLFGKENCEIVRPPHRADIFGNFDVVIELQHSNILIEEIRKREDFYGKMFWIVDAHPFAENLFFQKNTKKTVSKNGEIAWDRGGSWLVGNAEYVLSWKRKQKRWLPMFGAQKDVMLDLSNIEVRAGISYLYGKETHPQLQDFHVVKNSLFWMRSFYSESGVNFDCYLIGGSFISKQRILERYKP